MRIILLQYVAFPPYVHVGHNADIGCSVAQLELEINTTSANMEQEIKKKNSLALELERARRYERGGDQHVDSWF